MKTFFITLIAVVLVVTGVYFEFLKKAPVQPEISVSPEPSLSLNPSVSASPSVIPKITKLPTATPNGKTSFTDEAVPWELLLSDASCELKGEIKFLNDHVYDNQDALFIYKGVDHPARNIFWTITPAEKNIEVGPNIFSKMIIPNGQSLLGIYPKGELGAKKYEITATMDYGRLVDKNGKFVSAAGDVKVFKKQCQGKTTVVFP